MNLTIDLAQAILEELSDWDGVENNLENRDRLRASLLFLKSHSEYQIFGICADNLVSGWQALSEYLIAFNYEFPKDSFESHSSAYAAIWQNQDSQAQGIYLKFNPHKALAKDSDLLVHVDNYLGKYRGVLVSFQSAFGEDYNGTNGHFPLDLFAA